VLRFLSRYLTSVDRVDQGFSAGAVGVLTEWVPVRVLCGDGAVTVDQILPLMLAVLRENFNETVAKRLHPNPEIGKAMQAVEELMQREIQSLNSASVLP